MATQSASNPNPNSNEINWNVTLPPRLRRVHRLYMRIRPMDATESPEFAELAAALNHYLAEPEHQRREYERKYAGVIDD